MPGFRIIIAACLAVFAVGTIAATAAWAGEWDVGGKPLSGTVGLKNFRVLEHGFIEAAGVKVECVGTEIGVSGGELASPDLVRAKDVSFKECKASGGECTLAEKTVLTLPIHGLAELDPGNSLDTLILVLALPSKTFAVLHYEGEKCALLGIQPITGTGPVIDILLHEGHDPRVVHRGLLRSLPGLKVGSSEAILTGLVDDAELTTGQEWNFL